MLIPCDPAIMLSDIYHKEIIKYVHKGETNHIV